MAGPPDGRFEVVVECDKDSPDYQRRYEDGTKSPMLLILRTGTHRVVGKLEWPGDFQSDALPLRKHTQVLWNAQSRIVAITTDERFYTFTDVFRLNAKTGKFKETPLPSYRELTGYSLPDTHFLHARGHYWASEWSHRGNLIYYILFSPTGAYTGKDTMYHRVAISFAGSKPRVVARRMLPPEGR